MDTIFALSTGSMPSGVAVIRLSGPQVRFALETICGSVPQARRASLKALRRRDGSIVDSGLALYFPGPHSFTGEDCGELQVHGGRAVVHALLTELEALDGCRHAEAGEFTRRAFENGRMDLTEVEGLGDLIAAQTEMQRRFALELASGGLSRLYFEWSGRLLYARAMIEAELDFADEDDVPGSVSERIWADMAALAEAMQGQLEAGKAAERVREGFRIAIAGRPNSGKSSLINAIAKRDVAIVSDIAGTTRDVLSVDLDIGGYAVTLSDTAGLRESGDLIEKEGVRRAERAMAEADLVLYLVDMTANALPAFSQENALLIGTKADLVPNPERGGFDSVISSSTGAGLDALIDAIREKLAARIDPSVMALPTRMRHRQHLRESLAFLSEAVIEQAKPVELRAEDLRLAADALGRITGRTDPEDLLDVIFASFCIGK